MTESKIVKSILIFLVIALVLLVALFFLSPTTADWAVNTLLMLLSGLGAFLANLFPDIGSIIINGFTYFTENFWTILLSLIGLVVGLGVIIIIGVLIVKIFFAILG